MYLGPGIPFVLLSWEESTNSHCLRCRQSPGQWSKVHFNQHQSNHHFQSMTVSHAINSACRASAVASVGPCLSLHTARHVSRPRWLGDVGRFRIVHHVHVKIVFLCQHGMHNHAQSCSLAIIIIILICSCNQRRTRTCNIKNRRTLCQLCRTACRCHLSEG